MFVFISVFVCVFNMAAESTSIEVLVFVSCLQFFNDFLF